MSTLRVNAIQNETGTSAMTIDTSGQVNLAQNNNISMFALQASQTINSTTPATLTNWGQMNSQNTYGYKQVGSVMSVSSGIFTTSKLGVYRVYCEAHFSTATECRWVDVSLKFKPNGQSYVGGDIYGNIGLLQSDSTYMTFNRLRYFNFNNANDECIMQLASSASISLRGSSTEFDTMICFEWIAPAVA